MLATFRLLIIILAAVSGYPGARAQEASPVAIIAAQCEGPAFPPGTPVSITELIGQDATPVSDGSKSPRLPLLGDDLPAPSAPLQVTIPAGDAADEGISISVVTAIANVTACLNEHDYLAFAALVTPAYRSAAFGTDNPYNAVMPLEGYPEIDLYEATDVLVHEDGRLSADVSIVFSNTQVYRFRAFFIADRSGSLLLDSELALPVDNTDQVLEVAVGPSAIEISASDLAGGAPTAIVVNNSASDAVEIAVICDRPGTSVDDLVRDPNLVHRTCYIGGVIAPAGGQASFQTVRVPPGDYLIVAVVQGPDGTVTTTPELIAILTIA